MGLPIYFLSNFRVGIPASPGFPLENWILFNLEPSKWNNYADEAARLSLATAIM
jgi:hypothetical protein